MIYFKTKVEPSHINQGILITAPHTTRDKIWDAIDTLGGSKICKRDGLNNTQFTISPLPGYDIEFISNVAIATSFFGSIDQNDLDYLFSIFGKNQALDISQYVQWPNIQIEKVLFCGFLNILIIEKISTKVGNQLHTINCQGYRTSVAYDWYQEALDAYRRLTYTPEKQLLIKPLLEELKDGHQKCIDINNSITSLKTEAENIVKTFKTNVETVEDGSTLKDIFNTTTSLLSLTLATIKLKKFDPEHYISILQRIRENTPPQTTKE